MYKKFLINFSSVLLMVIIVVMGINYLYINTNYYNSINESSKFIKVPYGIDLANFGNSHGAKGFSYDEIKNTNTNTFNFALGSQTPRYDYIIFKKYIDHFNENSVAIFPISFFSLYDKEPIKAEDFKLLNRRYYSFLESNLIDNYSLSEKILSYIPALSAKFGLKYIIFDINDEENNILSPNNKETLKYTGEERAEGHLKRIDYERKIKENSFRPTPIMYDSYVKIIDLCKEKHITPVFITTPYLEEYTIIFSEGFLNQFYQDVNSLCQYGNVIYLDYSKDRRFNNEYKLFMDTDHLNEYGAKDFTLLVINDLMNNSILPETFLDD